MAHYEYPNKPQNPQNDDTYEVGNKIFVWNDERWNMLTSADVSLRTELIKGIPSIPFINVIQNVAQMSTIDVEYEGQMFELRGYNGNYEGGGILVGTLTNNTPNGVTIFAARTGYLLRRSEQIRVTDAGATSGSVSDQANAFSNAAKNAPTTPLTNSCEVYIPAGNFNVNTLVDVGPRKVIWVLAQGATVSNLDNLNGKVVRPSQRQADNPFGTGENAAIESKGFGALTSINISGIIDKENLNAITSRPKYINVSRATLRADLFDANTATYSLTSAIVTGMTTSQIRKLRVGMIVDTKHNPKYSGFLTSWSADGTVLNVSGWRLSDGSPSGVDVLPSNGTGLIVDPMTRFSVEEDAVTIESTSTVGTVYGRRISFDFKKPTSSDIIGDERSFISDSTVKGLHAYYASGKWINGFYAVDVENLVRSASNNAHNVVASDDATSVATFRLSNFGDVTAGKNGLAGSRTMRYKTSGLNTTHDTEIVFSGGTSTAGNGLMTVTSANFATSANFYPTTDNNKTLGGVSNRWSVVYAGTGTINTSDARQKTEVRDLTTNEIAAAIQISKEIGGFKWLHSVASKGEDARTHIGMTVQRAIEIMENNELQPMDYGFICYDEWDAQEEIKETIVLQKDDGSGYEEVEVVVQKQKEAGSSYGFRLDQLVLFCLRGLEYRISLLESL